MSYVMATPHFEITGTAAGDAGTPGSYPIGHSHSPAGVGSVGNIPGPSNTTEAVTGVVVPGSVSYTHLDVYKRQANYFGGDACYNLIEVIWMTFDIKLKTGFFKTRSYYLTIGQGRLVLTPQDDPDDSPLVINACLLYTSRCV